MEYPSALNDFFELRYLLINKSITMGDSEFQEYSKAAHLGNIAFSLAIIADKMTEEGRKETK